MGSVAQGDGANQDILTATTQVSLKYRHRSEAWKFEATADWSQAESQYLDIARGHFNTAPTSIANLIVRGDGTPATSGIIPTRYTAFLRTGAPVDIFDGGNYSITSGNSVQNDYNADKKAGRLDLTRDFAWTIPVSLKTGALLDRAHESYRKGLVLY